MNFFFINKDFLYYTILHFKFSSLFFFNQLTDLFSYEINLNKNYYKNKQLVVTLYNFHLLYTNERIFLFTLTFFSFKNCINLYSITELFLAANWLEREVSELHGILFLGKYDLRNLLLQYGDSTTPFKKSFPTVGIHEVYYNAIKDTLIQQKLTLQI